MKPYVNKYKTNDPVKDPNDLRGHNQPPGAGVPEYDSKIADDYFDKMPVGAIMKKRIKETGKFTGKELKDGLVFPTLTGPQKEKLARMLLDGKDYLQYRDLRVACTMIASASRIFMELGRTLREIKRDTTKSKFERVIKAQEAIVSANGTIKFDHGLYEMLGVHSLR